jgi:RNA polymerase sigma factor (sigma-70 family)
VAAVPSIGRADGAIPREADLTRALYERYATQIFRFCLHQLGSREEAEDAVQSTFLNAFRGIKRGIVPEHESAWLFKIAENVCLSRRRSTWRRGRIESPTDFDVVEELTPAPTRLADELLGLQDVLEQMPESQRRAILLREWQGLSYREIAKELELSQTAVETLIFRARRSLAKGLEAPPEPARKRRMVRGADLGNLLMGLKSLLLGGGAAAVKVAAVVAVVGAGTVVAGSPVSHHPAKSHHAVVKPITRPPVAPAVTPARDLIRTAVVPATPKPAPPAPRAANAGVPAPAVADSAIPAGASPAPAPTEPAPPKPARASHVRGAPRVNHRTSDSTASSRTAPGGTGRGHGNGHGQSNAGHGQGQGLGDPGVSQGQGQGGATDPGPTPPAGGGPGSGGDSGGNGSGHGNGHGH